MMAKMKRLFDRVKLHIMLKLSETRKEDNYCETVFHEFEYKTVICRIYRCGVSKIDVSRSDSSETSEKEKEIFVYFVIFDNNK